jgi:hypothetical protein
MANPTDAGSDTTAPFMPNYDFAPENFRRIIQRQIKSTVEKEVDAAVKLSVARDARYSNNFPHTIVDTQDTIGFPYFIVGKSIVGLPYVAAP